MNKHVDEGNDGTDVGMDDGRTHVEPQMKGGDSRSSWDYSWRPDRTGLDGLGRSGTRWRARPRPFPSSRHFDRRGAERQAR